MCTHRLKAAATGALSPVVGDRACVGANTASQASAPGLRSQWVWEATRICAFNHFRLRVYTHVVLMHWPERSCASVCLPWCRQRAQSPALLPTPAESGALGGPGVCIYQAPRSFLRPDTFRRHLTEGKLLATLFWLSLKVLSGAQGGRLGLAGRRPLEIECPHHAQSS